MDNILSSGSGRGHIAFYDVRAHDYISVQQEALSRPHTPVRAQNYQGVDRWHDSSYDEYDDDVDEFNGIDDVDDVSDVIEGTGVSGVGDESESAEGNYDDEAGFEDDVAAADDSIRQAIPSNWQLGVVQPSLPDFRRHVSGPTPTSSTVYHSQPQALGLGLTAQSNLWLQTGDGWLDQNHVYL